MTLLELIGTGVSVRKTIWSKRGDKISRRVVDQNSDFDIEPRTQRTGYRTCQIRMMSILSKT